MSASLLKLLNPRTVRLGAVLVLWGLLTGCAVGKAGPPLGGWLELTLLH